LNPFLRLLHCALTSETLSPEMSAMFFQYFQFLLCFADLILLIDSLVGLDGFGAVSLVIIIFSFSFVKRFRNSLTSLMLGIFFKDFKISDNLSNSNFTSLSHHIKKKRINPR